jgi:hypothetical protein
MSARSEIEWTDSTAADDVDACRSSTGAEERS